MRRWLLGFGAVAAVGLLYLLAWPIPVAPVAWNAPKNPGYNGPYSPNEGLRQIERVAVPDLTGPEDLTVDPRGVLYTTSHEGWIARSDGTDRFDKWVQTGGRPLGVDWDPVGDRLIVADAYRGLLSVDRDGTVRLLTDQADGIALRYADDVVVADDGQMYVTDASTKFGAEAWGGTYEASLLDILEHGGHGRVLRYDPHTQTTTTVMKGLDFANGIALGPQGRSLLVVETGTYRVLRHHLEGARKGTTEVVIDNLPGFPDNLTAGQEGRYWLGFVSSRRAIVDQIAPYPLLRSMVQRLPRALRPEATRYGHVIAFTIDGDVVMDLQDPTGGFARTTGALEHGPWLWVTSLHEPDLGRVPLRP